MKNKKPIEQFIHLMEKMEKLNKKIIKNPILFYGETGKELILTAKELHVLGEKLIQSGQIKEIEAVTLKNIPKNS